MRRKAYLSIIPAVISILFAMFLPACASSGKNSVRFVEPLDTPQEAMESIVPPTIDLMKNSTEAVVQGTVTSYREAQFDYTVDVSNSELVSTENFTLVEFKITDVLYDRAGYVKAGDTVKIIWPYSSRKFSEEAPVIKDNDECVFFLLTALSRYDLVKGDPKFEGFSSLGDPYFLNSPTFSTIVKNEKGYLLTDIFAQDIFKVSDTVMTLDRVREAVNSIFD
jgi:hypothetical protein